MPDDKGREIEFERNHGALMVRGLLLASVVIFGILMLTSWEYGDAATGQPESVWLTLALNLALVLMGAYFFSQPLGDYRTVITEEGLTRPGLLGSQTIRWADVTRFQVVRRGLAWTFHFETPTQMLRLSAFVFARPDLVLGEIERRVPPRALI